MNRVLLVCVAAAFGAGAAFAQTPGQKSPEPMAPAAKPMAHGAAMSHAPMVHGMKSDKNLVASAVSAAPPAVARNAAVIDVGANGAMRTVRKGTNGFTCMADNPTTPGPDPMCMDTNAMEWAKAWMGHQAPPQKVGFMYMLAGGTDASNTDPYAKAPSKANHWVKTGPHVMVVGDPEILQHYPASADPDTSEPYVMWPGTPYAHLMIPVR
jgi:hypothetical protein